ncbi:MAG TPA: T9SS type A sorting domain-containing protein [Bacteroidia bacterium]|nr:T9SS type A sorting domain-containing protein [Bacteroidia bacterium]
MKNFLLLPAFLLAFTASAQKFIRNTTGEPLTFTAMQRQYSAWADTTDLQHAKGWKFFKRWEMEVMMHTDASGEPGDATDYFRAVTESAAQRQPANPNEVAYNAWFPVGPDYIPNNLTGYMENGIGRINCIAFHPTNPNIFYIGVAQGGVWKTTNNGVSWTPLTDQLPILRISGITIDPNDPDSTMYISVCDFEYVGIGLALNGRKRNTHFGLGVYKTTDAGATWQSTGLNFLLTDGDGSLIREIIINPANSNELVACGVSGMYRSIDAGVTWTLTQNALFWDMIQDPVTPNTLYAASGWVMNANAGSAGVYKSTNFGQTWNLLTTGIPATGSVQRVKLVIAPSDPNYIYAITVDTYTGLYGIYKTVNGGNNWTFIPPALNVLESDDGTNQGGQGNYDMGAVVSPTNRDEIYIGGINMWGSTDGGVNFNPASHWTLYYGPTLHGDIHYITTHPITGDYFVCSDGGVYRTSQIITQSWFDAGNGNPWTTQWISMSNGMQVTSFYRLSSSRNSTGRLMAGSQDNASFYFDNNVWSTIFGGDGMDNYLDPLDDDMIIGSSQYGYFSRSFDDGVSDIGTVPNMSGESGEWTTPIIGDYNNPGTLYAGYENVMKSVDNGDNWTPISSFPFVNLPAELSALAVSNSNSNVLLAAKRVRYEWNEPARLYRTINGGGLWSDITPGIPDSLYYTSVEISETDANTIYVTMAGFSTGNKVFRSINGGTTWQNISFNLPNIPVNCIKYVPGGSGDVMIATDIGVYVLTSSSSTWVSQSLGLPNVIVSDIEFNVPLNRIYVSTFGRGIWATDLDVFTQVQHTATVAVSMNLFPSPNNGSFTLAMSGDAATETYSLEVIDVMGRIVHTQSLSGQTSYNVQFVGAAGMYYAHIRGKNYSGVKSFVVN